LALLLEEETIPRFDIDARTKDRTDEIERSIGAGEDWRISDSLVADTQSRVKRPVRSSEIVKSDIHCSAVTFKARHCGRYLNNNSQLRFAHLRVRKYPFPFWPVQMNNSAND